MWPWLFIGSTVFFAQLSFVLACCVASQREQIDWMKNAWRADQDARRHPPQPDDWAARIEHGWYPRVIEGGRQ